MYYKNYMINYYDDSDVVIIAEMNEIVPNNPSSEWVLKNTKRLFQRPRIEFEHCKEYLDSNGLYLSIFPPNFIEQTIRDYKKRQIEFKGQLQKEIDEMYTNIWTEDKFKELFNKKNTLQDIIELLNNINKKRIKRYDLQPIDINKEYGIYLKKYWGDEYKQHDQRK